MRIFRHTVGPPRPTSDNDFTYDSTLRCAHDNAHIHYDASGDPGRARHPAQVLDRGPAGSRVLQLPHRRRRLAA